MKSSTQMNPVVKCEDVKSLRDSHIKWVVAVWMEIAIEKEP